MSVKYFMFEMVTEIDIEFDFYIVYMQTECDDPYYPPYVSNVGTYKSKANAIQSARKRFFKRAEDYTITDDHKYRGVECLYYVEGGYFDDREDCSGEKRLGKNKSSIVYRIYDKEEQDKCDARWDKMHGKRS